ncbi:hypothetical protein DICPUDRAFT_159924 [Dictyostelium purpureum]|uniref:Uncharacterized protein n=1 Tax=Dictyostelium purpureum TaxID=5786 RepID=F1A5A6_DICPU|nr:uncharacterized protein DICPUDRAFT_159924 [Dictyostelium purpureum]EGC28626.1 hypothetical protein DICPUDRAFT_159924 [Dictyostelium purpureum]|eukprot:XP_003294849.1 hypothetical protein DICPUDRAFT_159924 [Dictyostelium purpureum]
MDSITVAKSSGVDINFRSTIRSYDKICVFVCGSIQNQETLYSNSKQDAYPSTSFTTNHVDYVMKILIMIHMVIYFSNVKKL